jgi:hypothetical protein
VERAARRRHAAAGGHGGGAAAAPHAVPGLCADLAHQPQEAAGGQLLEAGRAHRWVAVLAKPPPHAGPATRLACVAAAHLGTPGLPSNPPPPLPPSARPHTTSTLHSHFPHPATGPWAMSWCWAWTRPLHRCPASATTPACTSGKGRVCVCGVWGGGGGGEGRARMARRLHGPTGCSRVNGRRLPAMMHGVACQPCAPSGQPCSVR